MKSLISFMISLCFISINCNTTNKPTDTYINKTFSKLVSSDIEILTTSDVGHGNYILVGDIITFTVQVINNGPSSVGAFDVEVEYSSYYINETTTISPSTLATYTSGTPGVLAISGLSSGQSVTLEMQLEVNTGADGILLFNTDLVLPATITDTNVSIDDTAENFKMNIIDQKFTVKDIYLAEDGSMTCDDDSDPTNDPDFLGITLKPGIFEGGNKPGTVYTDIGYSTDTSLTTVENEIYFDIPDDILPNSCNIVFTGNNFIEPANPVSNDMVNLIQSNAVFGNIQINFATNTYSGYLYDFGDFGYDTIDPSLTPQGADFSFNFCPLGSAASNAPHFLGRADLHDITVQLIHNRIVITHNGTTPVDDMAYFVEYYDGSLRSLESTSINPVQNFYQDLGSNALVTFDISAQPDEILIQGTYNASKNGNWKIENRGKVKLSVIKQSNGTYMASGLVMYDHGNTPDETTNYVFKDYSIATSSGAANWVHLNSIGDSSSNSLATFKIYQSGSDLILEQDASLYNNSYSLFTAQLNDYVVENGQYIGASVGALGNSLAVGDLDTTSAGGTGANFTFDILNGSETGQINFVSHYNAASNDSNENGGISTINVDFEKDTNGDIIGVKGSGFISYVRLGGTVDVINFSNIDLMASPPIQLVTNTGVSPGVTANHSVLGDFVDPQAGGISISYEPGTGTDLDQIRVEIVENSNVYNQYTIEAANAGWLGRSNIQLNNIPDFITFLSSGTKLGGGSYVFTPYEIQDEVIVSVNVPDNYNNEVSSDGIIVEFSDDPRISDTFRIFVLPNADPNNTNCPNVPNTTTPDYEGETLSEVVTGQVNNGNTVQEILASSTLTPTDDSNGIAITAFDLDVAIGVWQYSTDNGATWMDVPNDVSDTNALLLDNDDKLRFDFIADGEPTITYKAWNTNRTDKTAGQTGVDTTILRNWVDTNADGTFDIDYTTEFSAVPDYAIAKLQACYEAAVSNPGLIPSTSGITTMARPDVKSNESWPIRENSGILVLESQTKGFVIPRMANPETTIPVGSATEGMIVYDTDEECLKLFNGTNWDCVRQKCGN